MSLNELWLDLDWIDAEVSGVAPVPARPLVSIDEISQGVTLPARHARTAVVLSIVVYIYYPGTSRILRKSRSERARAMSWPFGEPIWLPGDKESGAMSVGSGVLAAVP